MITPERVEAFLGLVGLGLVIYGVALLHVPAAFIVAGAVLFLSATVPWRRG